MKKIFLFSLVLILASCKVEKALEATSEGLPSKMDQTNKNMVDMKNGMDTTNAAIHDQQVLIPYKEMQDPANWDVLDPMPFKLMPYGKKFAEAATAEELVEIFLSDTNQIREAKLNAGYDLEGNTLPWTVGTPGFDAAVREKQARTIILQIIAGFTPEHVVQKMIKTYTDDEGGGEGYGDLRYQTVVYEFLYHRYTFINDVLLKASLTSKKLTNVGNLEKAIHYTRQMDRIARLDYSDKFVLELSPTLDIQSCEEVKSEDGLTVKSKKCESDKMPLDFSGKVDPELTLGMWKTIERAIENDLNVELDANRTMAARASRIQAAQKEVKEAIRYWEGRTGSTANSRLQ